MWYKFSQNNSAGFFETEGDLAHRIYIEAENDVAAIMRAQALGVYFDGVDKGLDCDCCGDRWLEPDELTFPIRWSKSKTCNDLFEYINCFLNSSLMWFEDEADEYTILDINGNKLTLEETKGKV